MSFQVYPDGQAAPLMVPPGPPVFTSIQQFTGASVPAGSYSKMMFIRVAATGGTSPPTLLLRAGGFGDGVVAEALPVAVHRGTGPADYVGDVQLLGEADNVQQVRMGFNEDTAETWELGIKNTGTTALEVTWVVAQSVAQTAQPWISAATGTLAYHGLVGESIPQQITIANKGTGPLTFTETAPALPQGFKVTSALPLTIPPGGSEPLQITFTAPDTPSTGASTHADLTADPPDPTAKTTGTGGHNQRVSLTTSTERLEVVLLLDDSGSMAGDPVGKTPPTKAESRWGELTSAANQFLDMLAHFGEKRGRFGIARFPAPDPQNPATYDIVPMTAIPGVNGMATAQAAISAINPAGGTPMGDGLNRVLSSTTGYFGSDELSLKTGRRWLILLSDGAHNSGTHNPVEFITAPNGTNKDGTSLADLNVHMFAVAYGIDGHTDVNHVLMKQLASGSFRGGQVRNVDEEGLTATKLALALRDALKAGLTPTAAPRDPEGFYPGHGDVRHEAVLTPYDGRAAFVLSWNTSDQSRLRLTLVSPAGEEFSPDFLVPGIDIRLGDRSQMYLLDADFLQGRYGTWTLVVTGIGEEHYVYDVLAETSLRMSVELNASTYFAGDLISIMTRLTAAGGPVTGASVTLTVDAPKNAVANWLAAQNVPADAMARAKEQLQGKDVTPILVKQVGAELAGQSFDGERTTVTLPMTETGPGVYQALFNATTVPERYTFSVTAIGQADGVTFRREGTQQTYVLVRPVQAASVVDLHYVDDTHVEVAVTLMDEFGNVLLVDPTTAAGLVPVDGGDGGFGELQSNLDGTYTLAVDPGQTGEFALQYGDDLVVPTTTIELPDLLEYADRVVTYQPGVFQKGAQIPDPKDALGRIVGKETAVPLGAGGGLTVGFSERVVLPTDDGNDVTVFVRNAGDLRAYKLEALDEGGRSWVTVGESNGGTASFRLADTGLTATPALRVTDLSGRTRDRHGKALDTPGVNIRGIGVRGTAPGDDVPAG